MGPNGPIPAIVIDQFGYLPEAKKIAVVRMPQAGYDAEANYEPGRRFALVRLADGQIETQGDAVPWGEAKVDGGSGDRALWFDFSEARQTGRYAIVDLDSGFRSPGFRIAVDVYREPLRRALKMFFYQRAGFEKAAQFAGAPWADGASHLGRWQDAQSRPWRSRGDGRERSSARNTKDLRGGWYDAGDYNKYTSWTARAIIVLLRAFEENPDAFDDAVGIPEFGNGVPDIVDEIVWGLRWLERMQNDDGSVLCVQGLAGGSPPSAARGPSYYGPATTSSSLMSAAAFAYGAKVLGSAEAKHLKAYARVLAKRAERAWSWAVDNPEVTYFNNDERRQPGSGGLAHGQQEVDAAGRLKARVEAAVYLYEISGRQALKEFVERTWAATHASHGPSLWRVDEEEVALYFADLPGVAQSVRTLIRDRFMSRMRPIASDFERIVSRTAPYRAPIEVYTWGSNKAKAMQARLFQLVAHYSNDTATRAAASAAAASYVHYLHGVNPLGLVYLTNMQRYGATHSVGTMFHAWFGPGSRWDEPSNGAPGPPPGYLVGGPNGQFWMHGCCRAWSPFASTKCLRVDDAAQCRNKYSPPLDQPPQKSFLQFNDPWPSNSWQITEPSIGYQVYYIRLLASLVQ